MPSHCLRSAYGDVGKVVRNSAQSCLGSHTSVRDNRAAISKVYVDGQAAAVKGAFSADGAHDYVICQLQFDEAPMKMQVGRERGAATQSVVTQHGVARWLRSSGEIGRQELILPPSILKDKSAESIYNAIEAKHPISMRAMLGSGLFSCLQVATDAASTNARVVKWWQKHLPTSQLIMRLKCLQNQTAITVSNMTLHLGFLCPMFWRAKIL